MASASSIIDGGRLPTAPDTRRTSAISSGIQASKCGGDIARLTPEAVRMIGTLVATTNKAANAPARPLQVFSNKNGNTLTGISTKLTHACTQLGRLRKECQIFAGRVFISAAWRNRRGPGNGSSVALGPYAPRKHGTRQNTSVPSPLLRPVIFSPQPAAPGGHHAHQTRFPNLFALRLPL